MVQLIYTQTQLGIRLKRFIRAPGKGGADDAFEFAWRTWNKWLEEARNAAP